VSNRQAAMDKMKPALALKGNNINGEKVFSNTCATCHKYGSIGKEVGPVLTEISRKSKATMLHDILDPNAAVDPKYVNHSLETKSGAVHMGIVANETDKSVTIHKIGGEKVLIKGNHDFAKPGRYLEHFKDIRGSHQFEGLILTHIPIHSESLARWGTNVHGHLHHQVVRMPLSQLPDRRYFNVSMERINYTPISLEEVKKQCR
jgi:putative heme-binding domain-containing protein